MTEGYVQSHGFLEELFKPFQVGPLHLRNRIVMPAMGIRLTDENGWVNDRTLNYYTERAKGGVGFIIVGCCLIRNSRGSGVLSIASDATCLGLAELAESIHEWGSVAAVQLYEHGMTLNAEGQFIPRGADGMSPGEIEEIIEGFAAAAARAKTAGFDAVEIHGTHGYMVSQFLSPLTNHRDDEYGGDIGRRAAFALAIVHRIKDRVGNGYPIVFRLSGAEYTDGGLTIDEARVFARLLEKEGVSLLHVSAGKRPESFEWGVQPMALPRGCLVHLAQAIKESVSIPVIAVGRINDPVLANQILAEKKADLIGMGRALLADPELPRKALEQRFEDIRKCTACMLCHQRNLTGKRPRCSVNAALGKEAELSLRRVERPRKIIVVGGGIAGLEAARVLASRGHKVTLYEKSRELGGQALLAARPPHKQEILELIYYLTIQVKKLGVKVELEQNVDDALILSTQPDAVVIATGGIPVIPDIQGINRENVRPAQAILEAEGRGNFGDRIVIIGGGLVGCETAEYLAEMAKDVTIVEMKEELIAEASVHPFVKKLLLERLDAYKVKTYTNSSVREARADTVLIEDASGNSVEIPADTVVLAVGSKADTNLADRLRDARLEVYAIGECTGQYGIDAAIHDGFRIGCLL